MPPPRRERKVLTVLFADLVGFTARSEAMDPEDVAAELARYQTRLREELERHGGTVEKFIGDAVMALFGAPMAHEDDPERAVRAALAIRDWALEEGLEVRIGVNTGEALVTLGARPEEGETMAAGDVVNTAARLQAAAPVNGILVGEPIFRATERRIDFREHEPVEAKGKAQPVVVFEALATRSRVSVERVHGARLVGRRRELDVLEGALAGVLAERSPQLVTLVGVPGIGKSRLVLELSEAVDGRPELISWRQGRCLPYGDGVTFWALAEMVKAQAGILDGDESEDAGRKLAAAAQDAWVESHLRPLVGLAGATQSGDDARQETFTAWRRFFEHLADDRPLVLVFEDLHWADDHLLDFVDHLVDWATDVPLLVVCGARPELLSRRPGWGGGKPNALTISLSPLSDEDTSRLLRELIGGLLPAETQTELLARAGGNPLYAEEFARTLRDRGLGGELPETVQGLIAARLDLLEPQQKSLVQDAAVVGKHFWLGALGTLSGLDRTALEAHLHALERREFVRRQRPSTVADDSEYIFRHVLVRDVAYRQIPRADRAEKHLQAARWIEQLGRREDHAEMLAYHYLEALELTRVLPGGDPSSFAEAARAALADAGDRAFSLNAYDVAARFHRAALELAGDDPLVRGHLLLRLGTTLFRHGEPDSALLEQARVQLIAAGDTEAAVEAEAALSEVHWMAGDRDRCFEHLAAARELADALPPSPTKAQVLSLASRFLMLAAEYDEAVQVGEQALAMAEQLGLDEVRSATLNNVGSAHAALGDQVRGETELVQAIEVARRANAPWELVRAMNNLAAHRASIASEINMLQVVELHRQVRDEAVRYGQAGFVQWQEAALADRTFEAGLWDEANARGSAFLDDVEGGSPHYLAAQVYAMRAMIRIARGENDAALADIERALALAERAKDPQILDATLARAAYVVHEVGDIERAAGLAREVVAAVEGPRWRGPVVSTTHVAAWTLTTLGYGSRLVRALEGWQTIPWVRAAVAFASGDPATAAEICRKMGAATEEAYARLSAARLMIDDGRRAQADAQLERALAFYQSVGATRYARIAESLLRASA